MDSIGRAVPRVNAQARDSRNTPDGVLASDTRARAVVRSTLRALCTGDVPDDVWRFAAHHLAFRADEVGFHADAARFRRIADARAGT